MNEARHVLGRDYLMWSKSHGLGQYWAHFDLWEVDGGLVGEVTAWRRKNDDYFQRELDTFTVAGDWHEGTDRWAQAAAFGSASAAAYDCGVLTGGGAG